MLVSIASGGRRMFVFAAACALLLSHAANGVAQPADCTVAPSRQSAIAFGSSGIVAEILVDAGDTVHAGQLIGRLESSVEETSFAIANLRTKQDTPARSVAARLRLAEVDLARAKALFAKGTVPQGTLDRAQAERDSAAIEVEAQKDQVSLNILEAQQAHRLLERRNLRSPFDGVVIARWISPGEYADRQRVLMIAKLDPLTVDMVVPATAFGTLKTGDSVQVTVSVPAKTVAAKVASVDPIIDGAGTFGVRASLANPDNAIPAGSRCTAEIVAGSSP